MYLSIYTYNIQSASILFCLVAVFILYTRLHDCVPNLFSISNGRSISSFRCVSLSLSLSLIHVQRLNWGHKNDCNTICDFGVCDMCFSHLLWIKFWIQQNKCRMRPRERGKEKRIGTSSCTTKINRIIVGKLAKMLPVWLAFWLHRAFCLSKNELVRSCCAAYIWM